MIVYGTQVPTPSSALTPYSPLLISPFLPLIGTTGLHHGHGQPAAGSALHREQSLLSRQLRPSSASGLRGTSHIRRTPHTVIVTVTATGTSAGASTGFRR
jgi:hypothetical protein